MTVQDNAFETSSFSTGQEAHLEPEQLFYSRTDERGVIVEGNNVFRRVSGFGWSELKGAPHKLVRHADMPKGVFKLYWDRLKAGKRVVAYIKNRTKGGHHYWVLALAWPIDGGYLSVRLKPTSELFEKVQAIYADLLSQEAEEGLSPDQSAARLQEAIRGLGYSSYESFMAVAISTEMGARARLTGQALDARTQRFVDMHAVVLKIYEETARMTEQIKAIRTVPMNMRIVASRLENAGGPISAISVNYGQMLDEMAAWVREFVDGDQATLLRIFESIEQGMLLFCAASLQVEMSQSFEEDLKGASDTQHLQKDLETLTNEARVYKIDADMALKTVETEAARLGRSVLDMKRYVTGLSSTRMMCKIENAALSGSGDSLAGIVDQLDAGQDDIEARLARIVELNSTIQNNTAMLRATD